MAILAGLTFEELIRQPTPSTTAEPEPEHVTMAKAVLRLKREMHDYLKELARMRARHASIIWGEPTKAQQYFDILGTEAAETVYASDQLGQFIGAVTHVSVPAILPEGYDLKINDDGTVEVQGVNE